MICVLRGTLFPKWICTANGKRGVDSEKQDAKNKACRDQITPPDSEKPGTSDSQTKTSGQPSTTPELKETESPSPKETSKKKFDKLAEEFIRQLDSADQTKFRKLLNIEKKATSKPSIQHLDGYTIGIYYKKDVEAERKLAEEIKGKLIESQRPINIKLYSKGELFFNKVNPPVNFEIRYFPYDEKEVAKELFDVLSITDLSYSFDLIPVSTLSPNFISIFVKPQT
ncbi:MAG: hypothetical protein HOJ79_00835 [Nitrospina sp.]|nr:hypothetical protein [Nitrospina sp.]